MKSISISALIIIFVSSLSVMGQYKRGSVGIGGQVAYNSWPNTSNNLEAEAFTSYYIADNLGIGLNLSYYGSSLGSNSEVQTFHIEPLIRYNIHFHPNLFLHSAIGLGSSNRGNLSQYLRLGFGYSLPIAKCVMLEFQLFDRFIISNDKDYWASRSIHSLLGVLVFIN